jgi:dihydrofolate reductase
MKATLIANVSANGKVLLGENPNHQVPQAALAFYMEKAIQAGNLILGRKTFDLILQYPEARQAFSGVEIVLLSTTSKQATEFKVAETPEQALEYLAAKGFSEVIIGGGTQTYSAFLHKGLVTELYLNIIPVITGDGGVMGTEDDLFVKINVAEHRLLTDSIIQLHLSAASGVAYASATHS